MNKWVLIRRKPAESISEGAFESLNAYRYEVEIHVKSTVGGDQTGKAQQTAVEADMQTLVKHYNGTRTFHATLTGLVAVNAQEVTPDNDPEVREDLVGIVAVEWIANR